MAKEDNVELFGELGEGLADGAERQWAEEWHDQIAEEMWADYYHDLQELGYI